MTILPQDRIISLASRIIGKANRDNPADGILRDELKSLPQISRQDSGEISRCVFAYYRWLGWLDSSQSMAHQIKAALEFGVLLRKDPKLFSPDDFKKAVPAWALQETQGTVDWLKYLQREPTLWIRARRGFGEGVGMELGDCTPAGGGLLVDSLRYTGHKDLFRETAFHNGEFELQDINSQAVGLASDPQPGETWWDACAGQGGKTLHLCDLMQGRGTVWASDRAEWRLKKLRLRAARAKAFNYRAVIWDGGTKLPTKTKFDGILVDAPCSGIGTWQRNPHARWTTTMQDVSELAEVQAGLISNVAASLKPGGRLIYSVCTLTRSETLGVKEAIAKAHPELKPLLLKNPLLADSPECEAMFLWPHETRGNGMFICGWTK